MYAAYINYHNQYEIRRNTAIFEKNATPHTPYVAWQLDFFLLNIHYIRNVLLVLRMYLQLRNYLSLFSFFMHRTYSYSFTFFK